MAKIMVVDDDREVRDVVKAMLEGSYDVAVAESLAKAREALPEARPEVVLIDHKLSDGTGDELVRNGDVGDASCVLITAFNMTPEHRANLLDMGFLYVVQKPFDMRELTAIVSRSHQHWQTKVKLRNFELRGFKPESVKKLNRAVSDFRHALVSERLSFV